GGLYVRRHIPRDRPHPPFAREDRRRSLGAPTHPDRLGHRLPVRPVMNETVELVLLAAGTAAVAGVAGAVVLRALRRRSLGVQVAAVAVVAVVGVAVGAWAGGRAMFLSDHDLWGLGVILVAAGGGGGVGGRCLLPRGGGGGGGGRGGAPPAAWRGVREAGPDGTAGTGALASRARSHVAAARPGTRARAGSRQLAA